MTDSPDTSAALGGQYPRARVELTRRQSRPADADLKKQNDELRLLLSIGAAISSSMELEVILATITELATKAIAGCWSNIYDYDPERRELVVVASYSIDSFPDDPTWIGTPLEEEFWPDGHLAVASKEPQVMYYDYEAMSAEDVAIMEKWGEKATLTVPLLFQGEVIGLIDVAESREKRTFSDDEVGLLSAIASQAAIALHNGRLFDEVQCRNRELGTMLSAAQALSSAGDLSQVLEVVAGSIASALDTHTTEIYDYDDGAQTWRLVAVSDEEIGSLDFGYSFEEAPSFVRCVETKRPVVIDREDDTLAVASREELARWGDTTALCLPMVFGDEVVGVVYAAHTSGSHIYGAAEIDLASGIAAQGAAAIENARAFVREQRAREQAERFSERLKQLVELSGDMRGLMGERELLAQLRRVMSQAFGFAYWAAYLSDPADGSLRRVAAHGFGAVADAGDDRIALPAVIFAELIDASESVSRSLLVNDDHEWTEAQEVCLPPDAAAGWREAGERGRATLFVPMIEQDGRLIGYIQVCDDFGGAATAETTIRLLEVFAGKAASTVELHRLHGKLEHLATTDGLTGLHNHRVLDQRLEEEVAKAARYGAPLSVLMIDIDDFKKFNDAYGHPQGDKLLRGLADIMIESTRQKIDLVARYGGEEFCIVLPSTPATGAEATADRLRRSLGGDEPGVGSLDRTAEQVAELIRMLTAERSFEGHQSRADVHVTVSIGLASMPEHGATSAELVDKADKALYMAKRLGKNRVVVYTED